MTWATARPVAAFKAKLDTSFRHRNETVVHMRAAGPRKLVRIYQQLDPESARGSPTQETAFVVIISAI